MSRRNTPTPPRQHQPGPSTYTRAPKGKACLNCRRRKLKCDCAHPVCSQCVRFGRERDCEYTEKDQRSRTEILEENIAILQARVRELEAGAAGGSGASSSNAIISPLTWAGIPGDFGELPPPDGSSIGYARSAGSSPELGSSSPSEPTFPESRSLIEAFLPYIHEVGFFLNTDRFLSWAAQQINLLPTMLNPFASPYSPFDDSDPLFPAVYLWGAILSTDEDLKAKQSVFLTRTLQSVVNSFSQATSFGSTAPRPDIIHLIQAEVLLANYYLHTGEFTDAHRQISEAVSLVQLYRLHKIRSPRTSHHAQMHLIQAAAVEINLHSPLDLIEEGERTCAFWQVFVLDKTWSALLGCPSLLVEDGSPNTEIDTPWPLSMEEYAEGPLPTGYGTSGQTIQHFVSSPEDLQWNMRMSPLAMRARAAALLYRASWFASTSSPDPSIQSAGLQLTDSLIDKFIMSLPQMDSSISQHRPEIVRSIAITHCLARVSMVQLHYPRLEHELKSAAKCMGAAKAILAAISAVPVGDLVHTDPVLPVLLTSAVQIMTAQLVRLHQDSVSPYNLKRPRMTCVSPYYLAQTTSEVIARMSQINRSSKLAVFQLETAHNITSALAGTEYAGLGL